MNGVKLQRAQHKTEVLLLSNCNAYRDRRWRTCGRLEAGTKALGGDEQQPHRLHLRKVGEDNECQAENYAKRRRSENLHEASASQCVVINTTVLELLLGVRHLNPSETAKS